jgi:hypothetical protein
MSPNRAALHLDFQGFQKLFGICHRRALMKGFIFTIAPVEKGIPQAVAL